MSHVFGPVPSRRLGRSLGVDLIPFKTCSYDCIYCQLGQTTSKTIERKEWVPLETALDDLKPKLASKPDWITLSGSGEPTLYSRLDELIDEIQPGRVQLNTATRPPAEKYAVQVSQARLTEIAAQFNPPAEIIADYRGVHTQTDFVIQKNTILEMLHRRPCTLDDIAEGLGLHRNEAIKYIEELQLGDSLNEQPVDGKTFYSAKQKEEVK